MWTHGVVATTPRYDQDPGFSEGIGDFPIQKVVTQPCVETLDDVTRGELVSNPDRQALAGEFVQDVERAKDPAIIGSMMHEVSRPDMVRPLGTQPDTGTVVEPQTATFGLRPRHFQPVAVP